MGIEASIHAALMARVEALTLSPALPVSYPGVPFDNTAGAYLRVTHIRNMPVRWGILGSDPMDRMGLLQLDIFTVISAGSWQIVADNLADSIAAHFPRDLKMTSGGYTARVFSTRVETGIRDPDGTHWQTPIVVDYRAKG